MGGSPSPDPSPRPGGNANEHDRAALIFVSPKCPLTSFRSSARFSAQHCGAQCCTRVVAESCDGLEVAVKGYVKGKRIEIKLREKRRQQPGEAHGRLAKLGHLALYLVHLLLFFKKP